MSDKESFLGEVGKKIPIDKVYDDVFHPALSEVGHTLQGAVKVSLAPISAIVWGYDKIANSDYFNALIVKAEEEGNVLKKE